MYNEYYVYYTYNIKTTRYMSTIPNIIKIKNGNSRNANNIYNNINLIFEVEKIIRYIQLLMNVFL